MTNVSTVGSKPGLLEWTADDRIRLYVLQGDPKVAPEVIFDVAVSEVQAVYASLGYMVLRVHDKKYRLQVDDRILVGIAAGGVAGLAYAGARQQRSGIKGWVEDFRRLGVKVNYKGFGFALLIAAVVIVAILALIVLLVSVR